MSFTFAAYLCGFLFERSTQNGPAQADLRHLFRLLFSWKPSHVFGKLSVFCFCGFFLN